MNWRNKHLVVMLIVAWFIFLRKPMPRLANMEEADLKLAVSAINDKDLVQAGWLAGTNIFFLFAGSKLRDQAGCSMGLEALVLSRRRISEEVLLMWQDA